MTSLIPLPYARAYVFTKYIRQVSQEQGKLECYLVAVQVSLNEAPNLMILVGSAMFCYVPVNAITFTPEAEELSLQDACTWDCLADKGEIVELEFVKNWSVLLKGEPGQYMFSLHFDPNQAWGRDPGQLKLFHFIRSGHLRIGTNNEMRWLCKALKQDDVYPEANQGKYYVE